MFDCNSNGTEAYHFLVVLDSALTVITLVIAHILAPQTQAHQLRTCRWIHWNVRQGHLQVLIVLEQPFIGISYNTPQYGSLMVISINRLQHITSQSFSISLSNIYSNLLLKCIPNIFIPCIFNCNIKMFVFHYIWLTYFCYLVL